MKRGKRGQFYLIAILVIISLLIGFLTVENYLTNTRLDKVNQISAEIDIEKSYVLDYIVDKDDATSETTLVDFSDKYIQRLGLDKDIFFVVGKPNSIKIVGNRVSQETIQYNIGSGFQNLNDEDEFERDLSPSNDQIIFRFPEGDYSFDLNSGQNIYYLIKYNYNEEVYIIHG